MSLPADPTGRETTRRSGGTHELRRRGRMLGFDYDVGIRITTLADAEAEPPGPPLLPGAPRLAPPGSGQEG